jgi:hypothetical protein
MRRGLRRLLVEHLGLPVGPRLATLPLGKAAAAAEAVQALAAEQ